MFGEIVCLLGAQTVVSGQRAEPIQTGFAKSMLPEDGEPIFLNLAVHHQCPLEIGQRPCFWQHRSQQYFLGGEPQGLSSADKDLNVTGRAGMAKLIEHLLGIDLHQVDILYEEPQVLIKGRCVDGVDDWYEGSPTLV